MKEATDVEMLDISNQLSTEKRSNHQGEGSVAVGSKTFKLMKRDVAGLSDSTMHAVEKLNGRGIGENVSP